MKTSHGHEAFGGNACTVGEDSCCVTCGVAMGAGPCEECGGLGYCHRGCSRPNGVPEYLRPYVDWSAEDFYEDAIAHGYTKAQAKRFAIMGPYKLGKLVIEPKPVLGWLAHRSPVLKDGGRVAFLYASKGRGRRYQYRDRRGRKVGPEQRGLAPAVAWALANGWIMP